MIFQGDLNEITMETARETKDIPALMIQLGIDEDGFMAYSAEATAAVMGDLSLALLSRNVPDIERLIHASLISLFLVGVSVGRKL